MCGDSNLGDLPAVHAEQPVRRHNDRPRPLFAESVECGGQVVTGRDLLGQNGDAAPARSGIDALREKPHRRAGGIGQEADPSGGRNDFQRQLRQLAG
jgi:hypothetical protein